jgi:hypothetical protein
MSATRIQCHGCKKAFSINGYSQHIAKTKRAVCRAWHTGLQLAAQSHSTETAMPVSSISWGSRDEPNDAMDIPADHEAHSSILWPELNSCAEFTTAGMDNGNAPFHNIHGTANYFDSTEEPVDVADAADTDLFEMMSCGQDLARNDHDNPMPSLSEDPATSNHTGLPTVGLQTVPTVTVERFPIEMVGIPIIGRPGDMPIYESTQMDLGDNIWAPFRSQCDWEIARWAKLRGPTSSAVADLFGIPEVRAYAA